MTPALILNRQRVTGYIRQISFFLIPLLLFGCGNDSSLNLSSGPVETASASFSVIWHEASDIHTPDKGLTTSRPVTAAQAESVDCNLIHSIVCEVYDASDNDLTSATFDCAAGQGQIDDIPVGSGIRIVILGIDASGNILYRGEVSDITITPGDVNDQ